MSGEGYTSLSVCDLETDKVFFVCLLGSDTLDKLFILTRDVFEFDEVNFTLESNYLSLALSTSKLKKTSMVFETSSVCKNEKILFPSYELISVKCADFNQVSKKNRLKLIYFNNNEKHSVKSDSEEICTASGVSSNTQSSNDSSKKNDCKAIVSHNMFSSTSREAVSGTGSNFVGLVNSGMTCYMNSLLQTLFMTPEFRNALYRWHFEGTQEDSVTSIPYQLQKLFVQLQASSNIAINTSGVTTSFGWRSSEVTQQQDIHELCRVLFDALEKKLGGSGIKQENKNVVNNNDDSNTYNLINRLYQGERADYVRCLHCNNVSWRPDTFLDIQIPLKPFESNAKPYDSLETALKAMLKPERLDGTNQYWCSKCLCKRDAERGCVFHKMPYLLTLQMMRFTFDPLTLNRIKLDNRFTFPLDVLDLSPFVSDKSHPNDDVLTDNCGTSNVSEQGDIGGEHDMSPAVSLSSSHNYEIEQSDVRHIPGSNQNRAKSEDDLIYNDHETRIGVHRNNFQTESDRSVHHHEVMDHYSEGGKSETLDSGVNSNTDGSPYDDISSGSPTVEDVDVDDLLNCPSVTSDHKPQQLTEADFSLDSTDTVTHRSDLKNFILDADKHVTTKPDHSNPSLDTKMNGSCSDPDHDDGIASEYTCSYCSSHEPPVRHCVIRPRQHRSLSPVGNLFHTMKSPSASRSSDVQRGDVSLSSSLVYELFSIMVHSGSIYGGHYYAYIKSFTDGQWYKFNDQLVTKTSEEDLKDTFGNHHSYYSSSSTAYFLMYRLVDSKLNEQFMTEAEFPNHIKKLIEDICDEEAGAAKRREREMMECKFVVYTRLPSTQEDVHMELVMYKDQTMTEAAQVAQQTFQIDSSYNCRLVQYWPSNNVFGKSAQYVLDQRVQSDKSKLTCSDESDSNNPKTQCAEDLVTVGEFCCNRRYYALSLWLECYPIHPDLSYDLEWRLYEPGGITFHVAHVNLAYDQVSAPHYLWMPWSVTVEDLLRELWKLFTGHSLDSLPFENTNYPIQLIMDISSFVGSVRNPPPPPSFSSHHRHHQQSYGSVDMNASLINAMYSRFPNLPQWALVLHSALSDIPLESNFQLNNFVNSSSPTQSPYSSCRINLYFDLGSKWDEKLIWSQSKHPDAIVDSSNQTPLKRLVSMCDLVEKLLYRVEVQIQLPSKDDINEYLIYRQLLITDAQHVLNVYDHQSVDEDVVEGIGIDSEPSAYCRPCISSHGFENKQHRNYFDTTRSHSMTHLSDRGASNSFDNHHNHSAIGSSDYQKPNSMDSNCSINAQCGSQIYLSAIDWENSSQSFGSSTNNNNTHFNQSKPSDVDDDFEFYGRRSCLSSSSSPPSPKHVAVNRMEVDWMHPPTTDPNNLYFHDPDVTMAVNSDGSKTGDVEEDAILSGFYCSFSELIKANVNADESIYTSSPTNDALGTIRSGRDDDHEDDDEDNDGDGHADVNDEGRFILASFDKRMPVQEFKQHVAHYLRLHLDYINICLQPVGLAVNHFHDIISSNYLEVVLQSCLNMTECELSLHVLDLNHNYSLANLKVGSQAKLGIHAACPFWSNTIHLVGKLTWTVGQYLNVAATVLKCIHGLDIPVNCLRLRNCSLPGLTPGSIYSPHDLLCIYPNSHQGLMLEIVDLSSTFCLDADDHLSSFSSSCSSNRMDSIFLRQWRSSQINFDTKWLELDVIGRSGGVAKFSRWDDVIQWVANYSGIPVERLEVIQYIFPGLLHCLHLVDRSQLPQTSSSSGMPWIRYKEHYYRENVSSLSSINVIFFKDSAEMCKVVGEDEMLMICQRENERLKAVVSPWRLQNISIPSSIRRNYFTSWSPMLVETADSSQKSPIPSTSPALVYGPCLPPPGHASSSILLPPSSHLSGSASLGSSCNPNYSRYREEPLRIYTAEDGNSLSRQNNALDIVDDPARSQLSAQSLSSNLDGTDYDSRIP